MRLIGAAGAVRRHPRGLARNEQQRIRREVKYAEEVLEASQTVFARIEESLTMALNMLGQWSQLYLHGGPQVRRHSNQALFEKLLVRDGEVVKVIYRESWATLLSNEFTT